MRGLFQPGLPWGRPGALLGTASRAALRQAQASRPRHQPETALAQDPVPTPAQPVLPAVLLVLCAVALFSLSDTLAKVLRQALPAAEVAWLRYIVFAGFAVLLTARRRFAGLRSRRPVLQVLRGLGLVGSAVLFITGLGRLPVAEATAISFISPAFITALSIPFLGEKVGLRRWLAVAAGLAGVLVVIRPDPAALDSGAAFPLLSALCWAATIVITRRMGTADRAETTLFWSALTGLAVLTLLVPAGFVLPGPGQLGLALALGTCASAGQFLVILAYRKVAASVLAPFSYVQILTSTAMGAAVFGAVPDGTTLAGAAIVIASGLYTAHRERVRAREGAG